MNTSEQAKQTAVNPFHYKVTKIECVKLIDAACELYRDHLRYMPEKAYLLGNVIKYLYRAPSKGSYAEDLKKAENYLHRLRTGKWIHEDVHGE